MKSVHASTLVAFVMQVLSKDGLALEHATEELKGDREIVVEAVSQDGNALQFATEELKGDRETVMRAVCQDGFALRYAPQELKADKEMMQHALRQRPRHLIGLKVVLLSGRCCDEIFLYYENDRRVVLRRCAKHLDLDRDHVERSGVLMCGTVEVQERQIAREYSGCDCELKPSALRVCCDFAKRASNVSEESAGNIAKRRLLVNPYGPEETQIEFLLIFQGNFLNWDK